MKSRSITVSTLTWTLVLVSGWLALVATWFAYRAYYLAPIEIQAVDPDHPMLRSSGRLGLLLGIGGAALILVNLSYLWRRRLLRVPWLGSLRAWMQLHVVSGLLAAGCVALHAAGSLRSASGGVAAAALAIVVATGIVGRYIYAHVPRSINGRELRFEEARGLLEDILERLHRYGVVLSEDEVLAWDRRASSRLRTLLVVVFGDAALRRRKRELRSQVFARPLPVSERRAALTVIDSLFREGVWLSRAREIQALMASWRFLHRWIALVMISAVFFHIFLAVRYGHLWILGGGR